jgi:hypothetical protein
MVLVRIKLEARPTTDYLPRHHGLSIDQPLDETFWTTQPNKVIIVHGTSFTYETTVDLAPGSHFVEYANSGYVPPPYDYAWHAKIYINDTLVAEGDVGRNKHLRAEFTVAAAPAPAPAPAPTKVTIRMSVSPALVGSLSLYDEAGKKIASTTQARSVTVDKGMRGYFKAEAYEGYMVQQIVVNGSVYMAAQTPIITFDRDMTATAFFAKTVAPPAPPAPPTPAPVPAPTPAPTPTPPTYPPPGVFYPMIPQIIPPEVVAWGQQAISTLQQTYFGLPLWAWIAIGVGGAAAIGVAAYYKLRG